MTRIPISKIFSSAEILGDLGIVLKLSALGNITNHSIASLISIMARNFVGGSFSDLFWERLPEDKIYPVKFAGAGAPEGLDRIRVFRDEEYRLKVNYEGTVRDSKPHESGKLFSVEGCEIPSQALFIAHDCLAVSRTIRDDRSISENTVVEGELRPWKVSIGIRKPNPDEFVDWYINGPGGHFRFQHVSRFHYKIALAVTLANVGKTKDPIRVDEVEREAGEYSGLNSMFVSVGDYKFLIREVKSELNPMPGCSIGIHYKKDWGRIPEKNERRELAEALSFIFDADLSHVASTEIHNNRASYSVSYNIRDSPTKFRANLPRRSPVFWENHEGYYSPTAAVEYILATYLEKRAELGLEHAMGYYHLANQTPTGYNFPLFYSAIQGLLTRWAETVGDDSLKFELDPGLFENIMAKPLEELSKKIPDGARAKILRNLLNSNRRSLNEQGTKIWDALYKLSAREERAMKARHKFAHGDSGRDLLKSGDALEYEFAFRRIFQRLLLILLEFDGPIQVHEQSNFEIWLLRAKSLPAAMERIG